MTPEEKFNRMIEEPGSFRCNECGHTMNYIGSEIYKCSRCDNEYLTEYGTIKQYLDAHKGCSMMELAQNTGIKLRKIQAYIREGNITATTTRHIF